MTDDLLARARARADQRDAAERDRPRIDYDRMQREGPKLKGALTRAVNSGDPDKVAAACARAVKVWDEVGCWPDDWSRWQRALDDALGWPNNVRLEDLA